MNRTSIIRHFFFSMLVLCLWCSSCTVKDPLYCDERTLCDKGYQCNLHTNTCEMAPDGGRDADVPTHDGKKSPICVSRTWPLTPVILMLL